MDSSAIPNLVHLAKDTDLLVVHAAVLDPPGSPEILYTLHTAPKQLGEAAAATNAKQLLLSHIPGSVEDHESQVVHSLRASYKGRIQWASNGVRILVTH
jgi:ribonuclease BN (tRNA processing enzyme)